jgi:hypothetical protein
LRMGKPAESVTLDEDVEEELRNWRSVRDVP